MIDRMLGIGISLGIQCLAWVIQDFTPHCQGSLQSLVLPCASDL